MSGEIKMYEATTEEITVSVRPIFLEEESDPDNNQYFWAYYITIENEGSETIQLMQRNWTISDVYGNSENVAGDGVIGKQPVLQPGESFEYTSGCPLDAPSGMMHGHYEMQTTNGRNILVQIPAFSLDMPDARPVLN